MSRDTCLRCLATSQGAPGRTRTCDARFRNATRRVQAVSPSRVCAGQVPCGVQLTSTSPPVIADLMGKGMGNRDAVAGADTPAPTPALTSTTLSAAPRRRRHDRRIRAHRGAHRSAPAVARRTRIRRLAEPYSRSAPGSMGYRPSASAGHQLVLVGPLPPPPEARPDTPTRPTCWRTTLSSAMPKNRRHWKAYCSDALKPAVVRRLGRRSS
jgi:hypothetical protein